MKWLDIVFLLFIILIIGSIGVNLGFHKFMKDCDTKGKFTYTSQYGVKSTFECKRL